MARNAEKAQAMLNRFIQAKRDALAPERQRRPDVVSEVQTVGECERWRTQIVREIGKKVAQIQNGALGEHKIRDLNDRINKLIRDKRSWEKQIKFLGGPDYTVITSKVYDSDGKRAVGSDGYFYFGAAKELPGVRELFEQKVPQSDRKSRLDLYKLVDADYYGYRDDDDGLLVKLEAVQEAKALKAAVKEFEEAVAGAPMQEDSTEESKETNDSESSSSSSAAAQTSEPMFRAHVELPDQSEIENLVLEKRKRDLLAKYGDASTSKV